MVIVIMEYRLFFLHENRLFAFRNLMSAMFFFVQTNWILLYYYENETNDVL